MPDLATASGPVLMQQCTLYRHRSAIVQDHHVCPKSWFEHAGRPIVTPMIKLCPTCHYGAHAALDGLILGRDVSALPPRQIALARQALAIAKAQGLTPTRTL